MKVTTAKTIAGYHGYHSLTQDHRVGSQMRIRGQGRQLSDLYRLLFLLFAFYLVLLSSGMLAL